MEDIDIVRIALSEKKMDQETGRCKPRTSEKLITYVTIGAGTRTIVCKLKCLPRIRKELDGKPSLQFEKGIELTN